MGYLFVLMGKSATGKDSLYDLLMKDPEIRLKKIVEYTTRPIRTGEVDGVDYHFATEEMLEAFRAEGKVIECRCYPSAYGPWYYFNVDDGQFDFSAGDYIVISTLEAYEHFVAYFGNERVKPLYVEISDRERLHRAVAREDAEEHPKYDELCRRFLADSADYAEENLLRAGITPDQRFYNGDLQICAESIKRTVNNYQLKL